MNKKVAIIATVAVVVIAIICWFVLSMTPSGKNGNENNVNVENINVAVNTEDNTSGTPSNTTASNTTSSTDNTQLPGIDENQGQTTSSGDVFVGPDGETTTVRDLSKSYDGYQKLSPDMVQGTEIVNDANTMDRNVMKQVARDFVSTYYSKAADRQTVLGTMLNVPYIESEGTNNILYMDFVLGQIRPQERIQSIGEPIINNAQKPNLSVTVPVVLTYTVQSDYYGKTMQGTTSIDMRIQMDDQYKVKSIFKQSR